MDKEAKKARTFPRLAFVVCFGVSLALAATRVALLELSHDPFTNASSQHATEVEPDSFASGSTIVSAFQAGRFFSGGASDIGFATSTNGGTTWTHGFLPGITKIQKSTNPYDRISDPAVAFDAAHGVWLISSLPLVDSGAPITAVLVSSSTDGLHWSNPVSVTPSVPSSDKDWIVCDNSSSSPFFGNCYVEFDRPDLGDEIQMSASVDGGQTWEPALSTADRAVGIGGQPLVQPDGTVIVPIESASQSAIVAFSSSDGGASWSKTVEVSSIIDHLDAGNIRSSPLPSAAIDAGGTVYVVWEDCRFRAGCAANDIVLSASTDGVHWSATARIPIDPVTSTVDHFIPGLAADPATSGTSAHLALTYYYYPQTNCSQSTCQLDAGFISSANGGATWNAVIQLAGSMSLNWLPDTDLGLMVGDYISTSYSASTAHGIFAVAQAKVGSTFKEFMATTKLGLGVAPEGPQFTSSGREPVPHAHSDHGPRTSQALIR